MGPKALRKDSSAIPSLQNVENVNWLLGGCQPGTTEVSYVVFIHFMPNYAYKHFPCIKETEVAMFMI